MQPAQLTASCKDSTVWLGWGLLLLKPAPVLHLQAFLWDVLVPQSSVLVLWDILMLLLIIYMCFVLPYAVAFAIDFVSQTNL